MSTHFHINGDDILEYVNTTNRGLLNQYGDSLMTRDQVLYLMNRAAVEGLKYGGNLATSSAHAFLLMKQCQAAAADGD